MLKALDVCSAREGRLFQELHNAGFFPRCDIDGALVRAAVVQLYRLLSLSEDELIHRGWLGYGRIFTLSG